MTPSTWNGLGLVRPYARAELGTVSPRTTRTSMCKPSSSRGGRTLSPVPRLTHNAESAWTARLQGAQWHITPPPNQRVHHLEAEKLQINFRPVDQAGSHCMVVKCLIVRKPHTTGKLAVSLKDQQLVLAEVLPAMQKVQQQNQHKGWKGSSTLQCPRCDTWTSWETRSTLSTHQTTAAVQAPWAWCW